MGNKQSLWKNFVVVSSKEVILPSKKISCNFTMEDNTKKDFMEIQQELEEEFTILIELSYKTNQHLKKENELPTFKKPALFRCIKCGNTFASTSNLCWCQMSLWSIVMVGQIWQLLNMFFFVITKNWKNTVTYTVSILTGCCAKVFYSKLSRP